MQLFVLNFREFHGIGCSQSNFYNGIRGRIYWGAQNAVGFGFGIHSKKTLRQHRTPQTFVTGSTVHSATGRMTPDNHSVSPQNPTHSCVSFVAHL